MDQLNQPESTRINPYQPVSTRINPYQPISTRINPYQPVSTHVNPYQPALTQINPYQPMSTHPECKYSAINKSEFIHYGSRKPPKKSYEYCH